MPFKSRPYLALIGASALIGSAILGASGPAVAAKNSIPGAKFVSDSQYVDEGGSPVDSMVKIGVTEAATGSEVTSFADDIATASGLQIAGNPAVEDYNEIGRTFTVTATNSLGLERLTVTRVNVKGDVPTSVISGTDETITKKSSLPGGATLLAAEGAEGATAGTLTADGQLTVWHSSDLDGNGSISSSQLARWAKDLAVKYGSEIPVQVAPEPKAKPKCSVTMRKPYTNSGSVFASSSLYCNQKGTARIGAYVDQFRGAGIWVSKASAAGEDKNLMNPNITRIAHWKCAAGTGSQRYRAAVLTRQLKNKNGSWWGSGRVSGPEQRLSCG
ncbi:hypothetical protein AB0F42_26410 [Streptomyces buecherae]|uniref:hypothetical protein n=1 Tax=Streptomyces buecherae TaxID=2763006 RepID=UPI0033EA7FBF